MSNSEKLIKCYTLLECKSCKNITKRKFTSTDFVFKNEGDCSNCDGSCTGTPGVSLTCNCDEEDTDACYDCNMEC